MHVSLEPQVLVAACLRNEKICVVPRPPCGSLGLVQYGPDLYGRVSAPSVDVLGRNLIKVTLFEIVTMLIAQAQRTPVRPTSGLQAKS